MTTELSTKQPNIFVLYEEPRFGDVMTWFQKHYIITIPKTWHYSSFIFKAGNCDDSLIILSYAKITGNKKEEIMKLFRGYPSAEQSDLPMSLFYQDESLESLRTPKYTVDVLQLR